MDDLLSYAKRTIEEIVNVDDRPFYVGVAIDARARWDHREDPHRNHYRGMAVIVEASSACVLDLEIEFVTHVSRVAGSRLVNRGPGGEGGLPRLHARAHVYCCWGGDLSRRLVGGNSPRPSPSPILPQRVVLEAM